MRNISKEGQKDLTHLIEREMGKIFNIIMMINLQLLRKPLSTTHKTTVSCHL